MLRAVAAVGALACVVLVLQFLQTSVFQTNIWQIETAQAAQKRGEVTLKVMVSEPDSSASGDEVYERTKDEEITKMAVARVRARLKAAKIKQFSIETEKPRTIVISARGDVTHPLLAGIVVPQGQFELRPTQAVGARWTQMSAKLPEGVEIRQEKGSFAVDEAYLWSRSRKSLTQAIAEMAAEGVVVKLYPKAGGWRTLALADPVATHRDISKATIRRGKTGEPFVEVKFNAKVSAEDLPKSRRQTWAVVLDSEVVATFDRVDTDFGSSLTMSAPKHLGSKERQQVWAQQVAGRLAAFMSVPLVEMPD
jgi:putative transposon-encoded protein